jgi:uncharacterized membrane protein
MPLLGRRSWYNLEKRLVWTLDMLRLIYMHLIACLQIKFAVYVIFYFIFCHKVFNASAVGRFQVILIRHLLKWFFLLLKSESQN